MKLKISVLALTALLILGLSTSALAGNSFNFLGESNWTVNITESYPDPPMGVIPVPMYGAISKLGTNYYLFQGSIQIPDDGPFLLEGAGNIINGTLYLTLTTSQKHTDANRDTGVMHVELDPATLNGNFYEVGHDYNNTFNPRFSERFTGGTVTCNKTIPLNPSAEAAMQSLLLY